MKLLCLLFLISCTVPQIKKENNIKKESQVNIEYIKQNAYKLCGKETKLKDFGCNLGYILKECLKHNEIPECEKANRNR
jgi:hypothetical protein